VTRNERTRILVQGDPHRRSALAREITGTYDVYTIAQPSAGLVMTSMRDGARGSRFYLGEVLVTECKVQVCDHLGLGIVAGDDPDAAFDLAVIDAACNAGLPETSGWTNRLRDEDAAIASRAAGEHARVLETRVSFQTMDTD
jgi:alpha-D-ribose 1-methylphosphonate 5-triphosphate synthase subunit PhnG